MAVLKAKYAKVKSFQLNQTMLFLFVMCVTNPQTRAISFKVFL